MIDAAFLQGWVGRSELRHDVVTPAPIDRLAALLDHATPPWRPGVLPPLGHWLFHLPDARQSGIGPDGHPLTGGFLPPVRLPRRMWAGSRIQFHHPVAYGAEIVRRSTIASVEVKGAPGDEKVFVTVRHDILDGDRVAIAEEQDIVYLGDAPRSTRPDHDGARPVADAVRSIAIDPVQLFRYSALTFNAHRIHYDRDYATGVEIYPGLVVQGPLLATLLMDHFLRAHPEAIVTSFRFRARAPLFDGETFDLCQVGADAGADLFTFVEGRGRTMTASVMAAS
ncbi:MaoC family dehydratase N-terminal domain-containing protein [Sphingomonas sp. CGMCC 1.13654]|uniref:MaoC family dehydratase N-terminal domain-containing protein n=1 Tax=Sphingomonas chungangi TaxID=2683589 RepID=A0A838L710_9SPHN|nr:MaoC family dehydratase N-terminal domain-containing protein [Sphingomonas chungangi]MBA2934827.1 MaoC family dehydratase N-terminal domain-containing protein [Sphingomonas chungangi]MVW58138.1 acyl-CoA dehydrogenase [Sphingomonas chungangi]